MQIKASDYSLTTKAFLLGINNYKSQSFSDLQSPVRDALQLFEILSSPHAGSIREENIIIGPPTGSKNEILELLRGQINASSSTDLLVFYFAGHGMIYNSTFFLCLSDATESELNDTAISSSELDGLFKKFPGRGLLFILDCCNSAGFAELAPSFFSSLTDKEFKILLSASRKEQNSWELHQENGTLFTNHLVNALSGNNIISRTPGLIYFTELFDHLSTQVEEDLAINYPDAPRQDVVFAGVFNKDPLLFVHKDLTLRQVSVKTTRYSKEYLSKLIRKIVITVLSILLFGFGSLYTYLDKSQFATVVANEVTIYKGVPDINMFGYPKESWTLDLSVNDLVDQSPLRTGNKIISGVNKEVLPKVFNECKSYKKAEFLIALGRKDEARDIIISNLKSQSLEPANTELLLLRQLKRVIQNTDSTLLENVIKTQNYSVAAKREAIGCLAKINFYKAYALSFRWKLNPVEDYYTQKEIILNIDSTDRNIVAAYLSNLLTGEYVSNIIPLIFEVALNLKIPLKDGDILKLMQTIQYSDGLGLGYHMRNIGSKSTKIALEEYLRFAHKKIVSQEERANWDAINFAITSLIALNDTVTICEVLRDFAVFSQSNESMRLLLDACPSYISILKDDKNLLDTNFRRSVHIILELARRKVITSNFIVRAFEDLKTPYHREILINSMRLLADTSVVSLLLNQIPFNDADLLPSTRVASIKALRSMGIHYSRVSKLMPMDWTEVTVEALKWQGQSEPDSMFTKLQTLLKEKDMVSIITEVLAVYQPNQSLLNEARKSIKKSGDERTNGVAVISMHGSFEEIMQLLFNSNRELRNQVADLVVFHTDFRKICQACNSREQIFPNEIIERLNRQLKIIDEFDKIIEKIPKTFESVEWAITTVYDKFKDDISDGTYYYFEKTLAGLK